MTAASSRPPLGAPGQKRDTPRRLLFSPASSGCGRQDRPVAKTACLARQEPENECRLGQSERKPGRELSQGCAPAAVLGRQPWCSQSSRARWCSAPRPCCKTKPRSAPGRGGVLGARGRGAAPLCAQALLQDKAKVCAQACGGEKNSCVLRPQRCSWPAPPALRPKRCGQSPPRQPRQPLPGPTSFTEQPPLRTCTPRLGREAYGPRPWRRRSFPHPKSCGRRCSQSAAPGRRRQRCSQSAAGVLFPILRAAAGCRRVCFRRQPLALGLALGRGACARPSARLVVGPRRGRQSFPASSSAAPWLHLQTRRQQKQTRRQQPAAWAARVLGTPGPRLEPS
jgi:hypothetical protein